MQILQGLQSHQVLQRNTKNVCQICIRGKAAVAGILQMRVTKSGRLLQGFNYKPIAKVGNGAFCVWLTGVPVGGPYAISLRLVEPDGTALGNVMFDDILVGDVWILAGQSNMEGIGYLKDAARPHSQTRAFYMDDHWAVAKDPIHQLDIAIDSVHTDINGGQPCTRAKHVGTGHGVAFGRQMHEFTNVPQGLIACAHGGTSMSQWDPAMKKKGSASLYGAMLRRFVKNGSNVAGVVWYQGCSEGFDGVSQLYTGRMKKFVAAIRRDFANARLPFVMVQIAGVYYPSFESNVRQIAENWNSVQEQQRKLPGVIERLAVVPAIDLAYDDSIHISGADQQRLGRRLSEAMAVLIGGRKFGNKPIELQSVRTVHNKLSGAIDIEVRFANVAGCLKAAGKPQGFYLVDSEGRVLECIYRIDLVDSCAILRTNQTQISQTLSLHYGFGLIPYCNIVDEAGRSMPVFGPVKCK